MHILTVTFHTCDIGGALLISLKALSNELGAFMIRIVDERFACHIMNTHWRLPSHLHGVDGI
jgi:hypothetical protein